MIGVIKIINKIDKRSVFILLLLTCIFLSLTAIHATDTDSSDDSIQKSSDDIGDSDLGKASSNSNKKVASSNSKNMKSAVNNDNSFTSLEKSINSSRNTLTLNRDYQYNSKDNNVGIKINKNLVIDGRGHTIDACDKSRIFIANKGNIVLKNMVLKNADHGYGSAIYINENVKLTTINVTFLNDNAENAGVVYAYGATYNSQNDKFKDCWSNEEGIITVSKSKVNIKNDYMNSKYVLTKGFISSTANSNLNVANTLFINTQSKEATAIYAENQCTIQNCNFTNLISNRTAGAIALKNINKNVLIKNCQFQNVSSEKNGGAIFIDIKGVEGYDGKVTITSSKFNKCSSGFGGAILQLGGHLTLNKNTFTTNRGIYGGASLYLSDVYASITSNKFINNRNVLDSAVGSAIYIDNTDAKITGNLFQNNPSSDAVISIYSSDYNIQSNTFKSGKMAIYAVFSKGTAKNNKLNGLKVSLYNDDYATYVTGKGIQINGKQTSLPRTLPSSYDLRKYGYVTSVKNQGSKNSCWSFATCAAIESSLLKQTGKKYDLSENIIVNSMLKYSKYGNNEKYELAPTLLPTGSLISWLGTFPQEYDTYDELGKVSELTESEDSIHIQDILFIPPRKNAKDNKAIKEAIYQYGGVYTTIHSTNDPKVLNSKTAGYYYNGKADNNHAVCIVGWDDNYSRNNFATKPPANGAWIVKNSYGTEYGDNGYMYVSYYDTSIAKSISLAYIMTNNIRYNTNYQTDIIGCDDNFVTPNRQSYIYYCNKYTMINNDYLAAVGTYFQNKNINYQVEIMVNGKVIHKQSGKSKFAGYQTIKLNKYIPIKRSDIVDVIVRSNAVPIQNNSRQYYQEETSFISLDRNSWIDTSKDKYTVCLKLYTVDKSSITRSNTKRGDIGYSVQLFDNDGNPLKNTDVTFKLNNKKINHKTNDIGVALLDDRLDEGKYNITVINPDTEEEYYDYYIVDYDDDYDYYYPTERTNNPSRILFTKTHNHAKPEKKLVKLTEKTRSIILNEDKSRARFTDKVGKNLANREIKAIIDGTEQTLTTDDNGMINLDNLSPGEHTITLINPETGEEETFTINVNDYITENHDINMKYNDHSNFSVRIVDKNNNPVGSGQEVTFTINGTVQTATTDENGVASIEITNSPGEYEITTTYNNTSEKNKIHVET